MHIATAEALVMSKNTEEVFPNLAAKYIECFKDMKGRSAGGTTALGIRMLERGWKAGICNGLYSHGEIPYAFLYN